MRAAAFGRLLAVAWWRQSVTWWSNRSFLITLIIGQSVAPQPPWARYCSRWRCGPA
jgi:hypothetical protein